MGQKVHPTGFRLGFNKTWRSRWYADKDYAKLLHEDIKLRDTLKTRFMHAGVSKIEKVGGSPAAGASSAKAKTGSGSARAARGKKAAATA